MTTLPVGTYTIQNVFTGRYLGGDGQSSENPDTFYVGKNVAPTSYYIENTRTGLRAYASGNEVLWGEQKVLWAISPSDIYGESWYIRLPTSGLEYWFDVSTEGTVADVAIRPYDSMERDRGNWKFVRVY